MNGVGVFGCVCVRLIDCEFRLAGYIQRSLGSYHTLRVKVHECVCVCVIPNVCAHGMCRLLNKRHEHFWSAVAVVRCMDNTDVVVVIVTAHIHTLQIYRSASRGAYRFRVLIVFGSSRRGHV